MGTLTNRSSGVHEFLLNEEARMAQVKDPVCGMMIDPSTAVGQSTHQGTTYYFCSQACKDKFDKQPGDYATKS